MKRVCNDGSEAWQRDSSGRETNIRLIKLYVSGSHEQEKEVQRFGLLTLIILSPNCVLQAHKMGEKAKEGEEQRFDVFDIVDRVVVYAAVEQSGTATETDTTTTGSLSKPKLMTG